MKKVSLVFTVSLVMVSQVAFAAKRNVTCNATHANQNGSQLIGKGSLSFTESLEGNRELTNITGSLSVSVNENEDGYLGVFNIQSLPSNPDYKPTKYHGYSQYRNCDAYDTVGSLESGMWGTLVVKKDSKKKNFPAHYIFQAGDHMGATLHLNCKATTEE